MKITSNAEKKVRFEKLGTGDTFSNDVNHWMKVQKEDTLYVVNLATGELFDICYFANTLYTKTELEATVNEP